MGVLKESTNIMLTYLGISGIIYSIMIYSENGKITKTESILAVMLSVALEILYIIWYEKE